MALRRRWRGVAATASLAASMSAGACDDPRPPVEQGSVRADTTAAALRSDSAALRACDLVSEQELEGILAVDLEPGRITNDHPIDSQCRWDLPADPQRGVSISLRVLASLELYQRVPGSVAAAGLGDAAVWNAGPDHGQLAVLQGQRVVSIALLLENAQRAHAEQIARTTLDRLPR
jgi:hypothetical protein